MVASSPRAPTAWLVVPLVAGYLAGSALPPMAALLATGGAVLSCATLFAASSSQKWGSWAWPTLAFLAAFLLSAAYLQHRQGPPIDWEGRPPREALLTLKIDRLFPSSAVGERVHGLAYVDEAEPHLSELHGRTVYFSMLPSEANQLWTRGTRLPVAGVLEPIPTEIPEENTFLQFLSQAGAQVQYRRVRLRNEPAAPGGFWSFCTRQHERFEEILRRGSTDKPVETVNVYVAMLLGKRSELTPDQRTAFLHTGTLHLFAISGLHIGVVALALNHFLMLFRVPPKPRSIIGLALLFCFVGITGAAPSAVRAFLMVSFFWGARFFVRAPNPVAALANSALLVLVLYPQQLWNAGFQLSYTVVSGILFLGLPLARRLEEKWTPFSGLPSVSMNSIQTFIAEQSRAIAATFAVSLSATLLSSPLSIHYFGIFAPGAVLLNMILVPAAGIVIIAGCISVFLGLAGLGALSILFNYAAWMVITLMEWLVQHAPLIPALFWQANFAATWHGPLALFAVLGSLLLCAYHKWKAPFYHFAVPFLVFILFLTTAARLTFLAE